MVVINGGVPGASGSVLITCPPTFPYALSAGYSFVGVPANGTPNGTLLSMQPMGAPPNAYFFQANGSSNLALYVTCSN